jgi:uncharacterized protein YndB with AHSA1/START domain
MHDSTDGKYRLSIRRKMPASRDVVFEAWTDPQGLREWMCPGDAVSAEATLDLRVGGSYRIVMKSKSRNYVHTGVYQVVERPSKLVFTWTRDEDDVTTLVTVEFVAQGDESELVLTHERFRDAEVMKRYQGGWGQIAEKLATYLAKPSATAAPSTKTPSTKT